MSNNKITIYSKYYEWKVDKDLIPAPGEEIKNMEKRFSPFRIRDLIEAYNTIVDNLSVEETESFNTMLDRRILNWFTKADSPIPNERISKEVAYENINILNYNVLACIVQDYAPMFKQTGVLEYAICVLRNMELFFEKYIPHFKKVGSVIHEVAPTYKAHCRFIEDMLRENREEFAEEDVEEINDRMTKSERILAAEYSKELDNALNETKAEISTGKDIRPYIKNDGGEIVQKAPHYQNIPLKDRNGNVVELEAWEIITSLLNYLNLNPRASWAMGDALKYILRCGRKFGDEKAKTKGEKAIQDLRKVAYYINKTADWYNEDDNEESTINKK